ncbi:MAG: TlpA disulfide reductase family protein [bacterium]
MTEPTLPPPLPSSRSASGTLAVASFVLGLIAFITGLFVVGGVVGLIGLIPGIIHLKTGRTRDRALAGWGIGLSAAGIVFSATILTVAWVFIRPLFLNSGLMEKSFEPSQWIGKPIPEMTLTSLDGRTLRTSDWKGRPVVLDMWGSWHPACTSAVPDFNRLVSEVSTQELQVLAVTFEEVADLGEFTTNGALSYPLVAVTNLPAPFGEVDTIPTTFFINASGIIRDIRIGYEGYDALKHSALDQSPPRVPEAERPGDNP